MRDVVIVGAGPVGLTAALLLRRRGFRVVVAERHEVAYPLPRAVHLDGEVLRVLQDAGVVGRFRAVSRAMPGLRLVDAETRALAEFRRDAVVGPGGHPEASMFDQPALERLLRTEIDGDLRLGTTVTGVSGRTVHTTSGPITADVVLACDGADSALRERLGIGTRELGKPETWLVVDVEAPARLPVWDGVHQVCDPVRATTFMRVTGTRYRWEFRVADGESPDPRALLRPWLGEVSFDDLAVLRVATYTFRARTARRWRAGNVFLLGDAAHETPPFIGQGLGAGLRDAHNLAWKLDLVARGAPDWLLDTYQAERLPHVTSTIRGAMAVGWALTGGRAAPLRRSVVRGAARVPGVSAAALRMSSPRLRPGRLVLRSPLAGTVCPQWRTAGGWSDDRLGAHPVVVDLDSRFAGWLRGAGVVAALIRPDRIVLGTARDGAGAARLHDIAAWLTRPA
ncbi:bifunctional 3-(3-hydroxy-phenyl)propionate/3-hydroxycinnamic acid hydroxylase [Actinokineospora sp. NBRC 105648]|uniref:bifunctional 3-(3-hydroxy-phenyl)propionate/3-hydroxycinnamic acid hydroxylase n=1 Tax=Actinokineospora sp. NBRC 105648 TaxID=3032206 RepID=UPI0025563520|nr:bifunctional 3-(3-hydroxy-phenyl)propionate/3-hydroxycinnamic acid hydroxylase [Actinokineospora sp. NBRC 105648]